METLTSLLPFFLDWLDLIVRWIHIIVGIAWIGTSFYFNWLDSRLDREIDSEDIDGELWSVHSGGFYHINKLKGPPKVFPKEILWFKFEPASKSTEIKIINGITKLNIFKDSNHFI